MFLVYNYILHGAYIMRINKVEELSNFLYEMDPCGFCCKENEVRDEYDNIAYHLMSIDITGNLNSKVIEYFKTNISEIKPYQDFLITKKILELHGLI